MSQPNSDQSVREQQIKTVLQEWINLVVNDVSEDISITIGAMPYDDKLIHALDQISAERAKEARIDILDKYVNKKPLPQTWWNIHREMTDELAALRQPTREDVEG